ncbi:MAG TPA: oligosaccharide flippase family protein [Mycobacteriales bacterium]|nr:oligosaccharide flippase family protein [Mycobacteriales bacterium]
MTVDAPPAAHQGWADESRARRRLLGGGAWAAADFAFSMLLGLPLTVVLVRVLPHHVYGSIATAMSVTVLLSSLVAVGLADSVARAIARDDPEARPGGTDATGPEVVATAWRMSALAAVVGGLLALVVALALSGSRDSGASSLVLIAIPMVMIYPLHSVLIGLVRVSFRPALSFVASATTSVLVLGATVVVLVAGVRAGAPVVAVRVVASLLGVAVLGVGMHRTRPRGGLPSRATAGAMLRIGGAVVLVSMAAAAISQLDVVAVGVFRGEVAAGFYAPLSRLLDVVTGAFVALGTYALVALSTAGAKSTEALARQYHWCTRWTVVALGPILAVLVVAPAPVLHLLYGAEPGSASVVVRIIAAAACIHVGLGYNGLGLVALGESRLVLLQGGVALLVSVVACLVLVPLFGIDGAAEATALALVASNLVCSVSLWQRHRVAPLDRAAGTTIAGFLVALTACLVVEGLAGSNWAVDATTFVVVGALTFGIATHEGDGWRRQDWSALLRGGDARRHADALPSARSDNVAG